MISLILHELKSRIGVLLGWGIGLAAFFGIYFAVYPEVGEQMKALSGVSFYKAMGIEVLTFESFIASSVVQFLPVYLGIYVIVASTATLAGEEESGTLDLVLAMPVHRWQIVIAKAVALSLVLFGVLLLAGLGNAIVFSVMKSKIVTEVTPMQLLLATLTGWPLTVAFLMIGMLLGAFLPNRRSAVIVTTALFIASYLLKSLPAMVNSLDPIKPLSLFSYFNSSASVFTHGAAASDVAILLGVSAISLILAVIAFQRRNINVGAW